MLCPAELRSCVGNDWSGVVIYLFLLTAFLDFIGYLREVIVGRYKHSFFSVLGGLKRFGMVR